MKLRYLFNFLIICIVVISCNSYDLPAGTPDCIKEKIQDFEKNSFCDSVRVERYNYEGEKIFCFVEACCCDVGSNWYDADCNIVCTTGTFSGTINCVIEMDSLEFEEVIWQKYR